MPPPKLAFTTVAWLGDRILLLDQRRLPTEEVYVECRIWEEVADAIRSLAVRGAPAIGVTAAFGVALAALASKAPQVDELIADLEIAIKGLGATRPTAVNLFWALDRMRRHALDHRALPVATVRAGLVAEAETILEEDIAANRRLGAHGISLVPEGARILTHCNAGGLATAGYGTALGVVRAAVEAGRRPFVWVDETRPVLQGARLTAWELAKEGIPHTVIADVAAASMMARGEVDLVLVGADRIAANGDTANKVGTYGLAVLAQAHGLPFYVAAPFSTIDPSLPDGKAIPIEERDAREVQELAGQRLVPAGTSARNPAFDVTPAALITAVITERGVFRPPYSFGR
ncbi:MAG: S-methyl-5-thioribose-1-phosphate isomerase [Candidatus Rokubacteria bacterium]|nr:S-methyl-5-thioribose-1-phosphate isomerase [Candidatus Rokubacteria bacterium]